MSGFIEIQWAAASIDEARQVSRYLVQEKLVACAQIVPWIESVYLWNGALETVQETKVMFKTREGLFEKVRDVILKNTRYEVPEVVSVELKAINPDYKEWLEKAL